MSPEILNRKAVPQTDKNGTGNKSQFCDFNWCRKFIRLPQSDFKVMTTERFRVICDVICQNINVISF
jgi:hypothetical protein